MIRWLPSCYHAKRLRLKLHVPVNDPCRRHRNKETALFLYCRYVELVSPSITSMIKKNARFGCSAYTLFRSLLSLLTLTSEKAVRTRTNCCLVNVTLIWVMLAGGNFPKYNKDQDRATYLNSDSTGTNFHTLEKYYIVNVLVGTGPLQCNL